MKYLRYGNINASIIAAGTMRIAGFNDNETERYIKGVLDTGINFFDHADIYGGGRSEELFGNYLKNHPEDREKTIADPKIIPTNNMVGIWTMAMRTANLPWFFILVRSISIPMVNISMIKPRFENIDMTSAVPSGASM